jgi:phage terminase large subunit-like protein
LISRKRTRRLDKKLPSERKSVDNLTPRQVKELKHQELMLQQRKLQLVEGLPHRYGWKWYSWARKFYESTNQTTLLCAANQISKSSTQIRKCIEWATNRELWPKLWKTKPLQFWYLYPSKDVSTVEFHKKWVEEFLPRGEFRKHAVYGWKEELENKKIHAIHFHSGVSVYFKTYGQDMQHLQTGTVHAIFCDEELPEEAYAELRLRLAATDGYFHMVFTATLNQDFWRRAVEGEGKEEAFPEAFKQQVTMYDCIFYEDGTPGAYSEEKIDRIKGQCGSETEIQRRVYGRFVTEVGRVFSSFDATRHYVKQFTLRQEHRIYVGIDIGGGGTSHPSAIVFLAVEPDLKKGTIFRGWRGDGVTTTSGDVMEKLRSLRGGLQPLGQAYDYSAKDFGTIATRLGENVQKADKSHDVGEGILNTLFRNDMLFIVDEEELRKLGGELSSLMKSGSKTTKKDDFCFDASTLIETERGSVRIDEVSLGDMVQTRQGFRRVTAKTVRPDQEVFRYELKSGGELLATPNHRVYSKTRGDFFPIGELTPSDTLFSVPECLQPAFCSRGLFTGAIQALRIRLIDVISTARGVIESGDFQHFIVRSGNFITGQFRKVMKFITATGTLFITTSPILNASFAGSIDRSICVSAQKVSNRESISRGFVLWPPSGIRVPRGASGIKSMVERFLRRCQLLRRRVWSAERSSRRSALERALDFAIRIARCERGEGDFVLRGAFLRRAPVYNITVEGEHEYFANGVLVANCDALRYAAIMVPWDLSEIAKVDESLLEKAIESRPLTEAEYRAWEISQRRGEMDEKKGDSWDELNEEFDYWNDEFGN